ncbi:MAG: RNA polymerase sigma factor [Oscillospiraceae bacterium]|jgi:RNA polymerase sigma-70 factor (ECF subfamily)|nr:RNA polymerase sigma factor [Oscillospiraceae bacterium]
MDEFSVFVQQHEKAVYNICLRSCRSADDAFDLCQEVFIKAWRGMETFRGDASPSTWLYRMAVNTCTDYARKKARGREMLPLTDSELSVPDERFEPALALEKKELASALEDALYKLPCEARQILLLRETAGLSYKEIGEATGLEEGTVKSRLARARTALRELLIKSGNVSPDRASNSRKGVGRR